MTAARSSRIFDIVSGREVAASVKRVDRRLQVAISDDVESHVTVTPSGASVLAEQLLHIAHTIRDAEVQGERL